MGRYIKIMYIKVRERILEIERYCKEYGEWPRLYRNPKSEKEKWGRNLHLWLYDHEYKYGANTFSYSDVVFEDGTSAVAKLDELYLKYSTNIPSSPVYAIKMVERIDAFVEKYGVFPRNRCTTVPIDYSIDSEGLKEEGKLGDWLFRSFYFKYDGSFVYQDDVDQNGIKIGDRLLEISLKAKKTANNSPAHVIHMIEKIEDYCKKCNEWPMEKKREYDSCKLHYWLQHSKYSYDNDDFVYKNWKDQNGVNLKDRLDNLYLIYGHTNIRSKAHIEKKIVDIQQFCLNKGAYPKNNGNHDEGSSLYNWFIHSYALYSDESKYRYLNFTENGSQDRELLRAYYSIFCVKKQMDMGGLNLLNLSHDKSSTHIGLVVYQLIAHYLRTMIIDDQMSKERYLEELNYRLKYSKRAKNLDIDLIEILDQFDKPIDKALMYFYQQYTVYSIANNNETALLYKCLYEYTKYVGIHLSHNIGAELNDTKNLLN